MWTFLLSYYITTFSALFDFKEISRTEHEYTDIHTPANCYGPDKCCWKTSSGTVAISIVVGQGYVAVRHSSGLLLREWL